MKHVLVAAGVLAASLSGGAQAQEFVTARVIGTAPGVECLSISARQGWQRHVTRMGGPLEAMRLGRGDGWTVDANTYGRVGPDGHGPADEARLAPYAGYKEVPSLPFGRLLFRVESGALGHSGSGWTFNPEALSRVMDFRINDTALQDNAGAVEVCLFEKR
ncbi:hypothetical protein [Mameliella sediminis]|uniref:hypothetical protein n=1 Tax=Mameliella sediminis TaxID=2836866 RepID=UPI001C442132|nr:hypothetical protein [Mameliella sediminis]MBV7393684.1 hypothetical protein [Mameliella sediminis]MBY6160916.1 hypothetical protein [Mameliella alba]MBY6169386.1 hypothetical protein [Mameliella alba]MBY6174405.1 hypothetical protein [Mameliella alba]